MQEVNLYTALREMERAKEPFSIQFVTYSRTRQSGGDVVKLHNVLTAGQQVNESRNDMIAFRPFDQPDGEIKRCYIWSIQEFNGKRITL